MAFRLSPRAEDDLIEIYLASNSRFGQAQAERYQDTLEAAFGLIAEFPEIARERYELDPPVRVYPCGSHIVIYVVRDDGPFVVRIRHSHEDWEPSPIDS